MTLASVPEPGGELRVVPEAGVEASASQRLLVTVSPGEPAGRFDEVSGLEGLPGGAPAALRYVPEGVALLVGRED
jgi:hypothetical protein